jgi:regulator of nucleoside diphosphate kinase
MQKEHGNRRKPKITVSKSDFEQLTNLATSVAVRRPDAADELLAELDRARVVSDGWMSEDVVQMDTAVRYRTDAGDTRTTTLVFPGDADISVGKVSVLTPIGTALLGLSAGQSMRWLARDGREHELTVISVGQGPSSRSSGDASGRLAAWAAGA